MWLNHALQGGQQEVASHRVHSWPIPGFALFLCVSNNKKTLLRTVLFMQKLIIFKIIFHESAPPVLTVTIEQPGIQTNYRC